jgi:hypothetical protein
VAPLQDGPFLERGLLGDSPPVTKDELIALERPIGANLALGCPKQDRITTVAAQFARHSLFSR